MADLLEAMRRNPKADWTIDDVKKVCARNDVACVPPRGGGGHYKVSHPRITHILTVPFRRPIKPLYIELLVDFIDNVRNLP